MQPFQCDPQPQIQHTHRTTHTGATTRCRTQRRNTFATETTAAAPAAHTRYLSSPAAATLHGNARFRAPASSPKQNPCNIHAAITMRFAASCNKPASLYAHGNTRSQQSCSHSNAIRNRRLHRTTHAGATTRCRTQRRNTFATETTAAAPAAHTRYLSALPAATLFTRKNTRFRAPASSPKQNPCNIHAAITTSLSVLLCDVKSHTTVSHRPSLRVLLCDVKSHTTVSHHPSLSVLIQVKIIRNSEDCFPTSFDYMNQ